MRLGCVPGQLDGQRTPPSSSIQSRQMHGATDHDGGYNDFAQSPDAPSGSQGLRGSADDRSIWAMRGGAAPENRIRIPAVTPNPL
jgi:hypothetical protein